ncbi:MAG: hypothetical protein AAFV29_13215, partial [Myxococcota bacterium]
MKSPPAAYRWVIRAAREASQGPASMLVALAQSAPLDIEGVTLPGFAPSRRAGPSAIGPSGQRAVRLLDG